MYRILILGLLLSANIHATEIVECLDREIISQPSMKAPLVTELRTGSVSVLGLVGKNGKVKSTKILSQQGDIRWGKPAENAMEKTVFKPADKACEFKYVYTARIESNAKEN